jgi:hypothetical protein
MRDRRVERVQQIGPGIDADQRRRLAERVVERGHFRPAERSGAVVILPPDDDARFILPVSVPLRSVHVEPLNQELEQHLHRRACPSRGHLQEAG